MGCFVLYIFTALPNAALSVFSIRPGFHQGQYVCGAQAAAEHHDTVDDRVRDLGFIQCPFAAAAYGQKQEAQGDPKGFDVSGKRFAPECENHGQAEQHRAAQYHVDLHKGTPFRAVTGQQTFKHDLPGAIEDERADKRGGDFLSFYDEHGKADEGIESFKEPYG